MTQQFENSKVTKIDVNKVSDTTTQKKEDRIADKAAEKPAKTEQHYDKKNSNLFTK